MVPQVSEMKEKPSLGTLLTAVRVPERGIDSDYLRETSVTDRRKGKGRETERWASVFRSTEAASQPVNGQSSEVAGL